MNFLQLATQIQKEVDGEFTRLKELEQKINSRSSAVGARAAAILVKEGELNAAEKDIQRRLEDVSRRELTVRRDEEVQKDLSSASALAKDAAEDRKKAQELRDDATMKLEDLEKRELALSEREKVYKQELELEVMRNFTFRK